MAGGGLQMGQVVGDEVGMQGGQGDPVDPVDQLGGQERAQERRRVARILEDGLEEGVMGRRGCGHTAGGPEGVSGRGGCQKARAAPHRTGAKATECPGKRGDGPGAHLP